MKKLWAIGIAAVTLQPYVTGATGFWLLSHGHSDSLFFGNKANGYFGPFEWLVMGGWGLSLAIFSIHIQMNQRIEKPEKDRLRMRIWFYQLFALIPYWLRWIWPCQS